MSTYVQYVLICANVLPTHIHKLKLKDFVRNESIEKIIIKSDHVELSTIRAHMDKYVLICANVSPTHIHHLKIKDFVRNESIEKLIIKSDHVELSTF